MVTYKRNKALGEGQKGLLLSMSLNLAKAFDKFSVKFAMFFQNKL